MPLSEEELRLLEQMERALSEEDPKFASTLRGTTIRQVQRRRAALAAVVFVVGIAVLMTGAIAQMIPVGVVGFLIMLGSATYGLAALRSQSSAADPGAARATGHEGFSVIDGGKKARRPKQRSGGSFMDRMEDRWRRRREGGF